MKQVKRKVKIIEGVVADYNGKYWGKQHGDAQYTCNDFGDLDNADISNPEFCTKPTDKTYDPTNTNGRNPDYDQLSKARLIKVRKTITTEIEIIE
jgi:hypothetical protein